MNAGNVMCGLSGLEITPITKVGLVFLTERLTTLSPGKSSFKDNPFLENRPLLPPIYGEYSDGSRGSIINIQQNVATRILEEYFSLPIENIVEILTSSHWSAYGHRSNYSVVKNFHPNLGKMGILENFLEAKDSLSDYLAAFGFREKSENVYSFREYNVVFNVEANQILITCGARILKTAKTTGVTSNLAEKTLEGFGAATGLWPGYPEETWEQITLLKNLYGMFYRKDVFDNLIKVLDQEEFYQKDVAVYRVAENWGTPEDYDYRTSGFNSNTINEENLEVRKLLFLSLPAKARPGLAAYKENIEEFLDIKRVLHLLAALGKPLQPTQATKELPTYNLQTTLNKVVTRLIR